MPELRNWYKVGKMYRGAFYGDSRFKDGTVMYTDYIKNVIDKQNENWIIIETFGGSKFLLWRDKHHSEKQDVQEL